MIPAHPTESRSLPVGKPLNKRAAGRGALLGDIDNQALGDELLPKSTDLGKDGIGRLMLRLAVPAIAAQVINALYNIVDRMYIGNLPGQQGTQSIAALGVSLPLIVVISAFGSLVGIGGSALAAIRMGENRQETANRIMNNCLPLLVIFSVLLTAVCEFFCRDLLMLVGATENTIDYAQRYFSIYAWGTLPVLLVLGLNAFINTQGFAATSMLTVLIGAVCNIILDPILIYGFNMGVTGAAVATVFFPDGFGGVGHRVSLREKDPAAALSAPYADGWEADRAGAGPGGLPLHHERHRKPGGNRHQHQPAPGQPGSGHGGYVCGGLFHHRQRHANGDDAADRTEPGGAAHHQL